MKRMKGILLGAGLEVEGGKEVRDRFGEEKL